MPNLNLSTGGEFSPYLKYNAKAGRWFVRGENATDIEIVNPRFAIDLENIRVGWVLFPQASPPSFLWDVQGVRAPKPDGDYKDGFKVFIMGTDIQPALANKPLGVREWSSNAYAAKAGMMDIHRQYQEGKAQNPDKVPVARCISVKVIKGEYGDSFEPVFVIEAWVERSRLPQLTAAITADIQSTSPVAPAPQPVQVGALGVAPPSPQGVPGAPVSSPLQQAADKLGQAPTDGGHTPTVTPPYVPPKEPEKPFSEAIGDDIPF